ncbi:glycosyltransferase family 2 protein [Pseudaminobacter sp. 19-2017]|uniref:Glycosyltransferase family 2 protein n=1 Tax=Pseudaminobacter soli (ex Zhang et al. 2022) TaxID=2831468 RepID=A0A942E2A4_9HYPH|nr:glycosyltransferase family A protein [Pseudaminobacter soli]MBS3647232.1 glycosyltransferase family 2 protein [Pseudaminobacter soli]
MKVDSVPVGVVVPMYNAERTIGATLESVRGQSYPALDIIVVDDGSTDGSAAIVEEHACRDPRIRLIRQENGGVAAARNLGAASTEAEFLAFVDADDLWAPSKIAQQLWALQEGGPTVGLAYCWFAQIDAESRVYSLDNRPSAEGWVLRRMCRNNFVGNGSSLMLRRAAFDAAGGFDPSLRARNAQGCEDMLMCLRVAAQFEFRVVPQYLVGYRMTNSNMSSDVRQMLRSCEIVFAEFREKHPELRDDLDAHLVDMLQWLVVRALVGGCVLAAGELMRRLATLEPRMALSRLPGMLDTYCRARLVPQWAKAGWRRVRGAQPRPPYGEMAW